jgi:hypothetical protein
MEKKRHKALTTGEKTYIGNPCKVCGEKKRYTMSMACVCCSRRHNRNHRAKLRVVFQQAQAEKEI